LASCSEYRMGASVKVFGSSSACLHIHKTNI
jgi:hypothetical protein